MHLNEYMSEMFPNLELRPPLFYSWEIAIRFELGVEEKREYFDKNSLYLKGVYEKAITLFKSLHLDNEEVFVVANVNDFGDGTTFKHKLKIFSRYVQEKTVLNKLNHTIIPYVFPDDDENQEYKTHRFILKCKTSDIKYIACNC